MKEKYTIPLLPLPKLEDTLEKYLKTIEPFLSEQGLQKAFELVEEFKQGPGQILQKRLEERASKCTLIPEWEPIYDEDENDYADEEWVGGKKISQIEPTRNSWLIDWWNQYSYLRYREPLVLNVSFFFVFPLNCEPMVSRAAKIIYYALEFKNDFVEGKLPPDMMRDIPLCMTQFHYLFNSCRVPDEPADRVKLYNPRKHNHVTIVRRNHFYRLDLKKNDRFLTIDEMELQLFWILKDADALGDAENVGMLTAAHRDVWAKNYHLLKKNNKKFLSTIQSSSFLLCLDTATPITRDELASLCWHGYGENRWFDKSLQFIVFQNGRAGFLGEHSMMDATTPARLCDFICSKSKDHQTSSISSSKLSLSNVDVLAQRLECNLTNELKDLITETEKILLKEIGNHQVQTLHYTRYGKGFIKSQSMSPDSYVQMGIQLAYFKLMRTFVATYESAGMRRYQWGRTETCRSVSTESVEFCKAMEDSKVSLQEKCELAREAVGAHSKYMSECLQGQGIDRHFLGLRLSVAPGESMPAFFLDPVYNVSCHWTLSTSQIPTEYFEGYGWGEVVPDGFGVAYMVREDRLMFNIAGLVGDCVPDLDEHLHHETVDTPQPETYFLKQYKMMRVKWFKACLEEAFDDLFQLFSTVSQQQQQKPSTVRRQKSVQRSRSVRSDGTQTVTPPEHRPASIRSIPSTSNLGMSLAYPSRRELDGVVGEDVGLIEFEIDWGEQWRRDPGNESRRKKLIKWLWAE